MTKCPICDSETKFYQKKKFSRTLTNPPDVSFHKCPKCELIFCVDTQEWDENKFYEMCYGNHYEVIDPDGLGARPIRTADFLERRYKPSSLFDYGCGSGYMVDILNGRGFSATGFDPFSSKEKYHTFDSDNKYQIITAIEVLEHLSRPNIIFETVDKIISDTGEFFATTLLYPNDVSLTDWWYSIEGRSGHVSFYTNMTLHIIAEIHNLELVESNLTDHFFKRK